MTDAGAHGIEPGPSRMLSGCDATTPAAPELSRPRVLNYLLRTAFSAEGRVPKVTFESYIESRKLAVARAQPARTASRPAR